MEPSKTMSLHHDNTDDQDDDDFNITVIFQDVYAIHATKNDEQAIIESYNGDFPILNPDMVNRKVELKIPEKPPDVYKHEGDENFDALLGFLANKSFEEDYNFEQLLGDTKFVCARRVLTHIALIPHDDGSPGWTIDVQRFRGVYFMRFRHAKTIVTNQKKKNMELKQVMIDAIGDHVTKNRFETESYALFNVKIPSTTAKPHSILYSAVVDGAFGYDGPFFDCFTINNKFDYRKRHIKYALKAALLGSNKVVVGHRHPYKYEITEVQVLETEKNKVIDEDHTISIKGCFKTVSSFLSAIETEYYAAFGMEDGVLHITRTPYNDNIEVVAEEITDNTSMVCSEVFLNHFLKYRVYI